MKIKRLLLVFGALALSLTSCDLQGKEVTTTTKTDVVPSETIVPTESTNDVPVSSTEKPTTSTTPQVPTTTVTVPTTTTTLENTYRNKPSDLSKTATLYIVGDSTVDDS